MWQFVKDVPGIVKFGAGLVGGVAAAFGIMLGPVSANTARLDDIEPAVEMLTCWAEHEIQGTDPTGCLFLNGEL